ncbi:CASP8 and FADD-like apoptosis regulator isoform X3 [Anguilla rostrata]|uniref:CASP8 and FADD-like apoptosis regulator isoform X3 n=1 Tax=Anguilla rostrata TaxID=7938 RepID=UPI0030D5BEB7
MANRRLQYDGDLEYGMTSLYLFKPQGRNYAMADGQLSQTINRISEELSLDERRRLLYLCGDLRQHCSAEDVRRMLKSKMTCREVDQMFLLELMLRMRRFDILKKVLRTNRQEAEGMLGKGYNVSEYRVLMADVSQDMGKEDLSSLIFLLSGKIPKGQLEKATSFLDVVVELEMLDKVSCDKVDLIYECLRNIRRVDLAKKVQQYQMRAAGEMPQSNCTLRRSVEKQQCLRKIPSYGVFPPRAPSSSPAMCHWSRKPHAPENIKLAVPETGRQFCQGPVEAYRMRSEPRGVCLIVDCVGNDGDMLAQTFRQLHFRVVLRKWLSVGDTLSALRDAAGAREHHEADAFICCILSRTAGDDLLATQPQGPGLHLQAIRQLFTTEACPGLAGKPKLFFIQGYGLPAALSAFRDEDLETDVETDVEADRPADGLRLETVPDDADVVWSLCRTDARQLENSRHRSVYMQSLITALLKGQRRGMHLVDVHTEVNRAIYDHNQRHQGEAYHISLRHTLRKNLFI